MTKYKPMSFSDTYLPYLLLHTEQQSPLGNLSRAQDCLMMLLPSVPTFLMRLRDCSGSNSDDGDGDDDVDEDNNVDEEDVCLQLF